MTPKATTTEQKNAYDIAFEKINDCHIEGRATLELRNLGLTELPPEIGLLTGLTALNLTGNRLITLPPEIGLLTGLTVLNLMGNRLITLPPEIGQLTALTNLDLRGNDLSTLPPEFCQLTALTVLDLMTNELRILPPSIGQLTALISLDLMGNGLSFLPPEIGQLRALRLLDLMHNELSALPPEIGQLTALKELTVMHNQLSVLPPEIGRLSSLRQFYLSGNKLSILPSEIGQLTELMTFDISHNELSILPPEIGQLRALNDLDLANNQLSSLPSEIGQLRALSQLDLSNNQLSSLPSEIGQLMALTVLNLKSNKLRKLPEWFRGLLELKYLFLHDNPPLLLSPTVLGPNSQHSKKKGVSPKSILDFYFGKKAENTKPLNEVKLILVGRGGAGKTSTVQALQGLPFNESEESTPGIALCDWKMDGCKGSPVTAHVWDFAGQVITHALHQFFFSMRSVYVVVLTGRENNERDDAEYWLRLINAFGTDEQGNGPPVIVALNKWDVAGCRPTVDRGALLERYPFIRDFVEIDCKTQKGILKLKKTLCREVDRLKWVREDFPESWNVVRHALTAGRKRRAHLTYSEYRALCVKYGVTNEGQQDSLAEILHNLGAALNYRSDPRLREATVLQPEWLTKNVYALVRRAEKQAGVLKSADVAQVLRAEKDESMRDYLLKIMERFEIAYAPRAMPGIWLVPQALPDTQPKGVEIFRDATDATRLRYAYQALPEGLVAKAIVRLNEFIEEVNGKKQQWASGAVLVRDGARALIRSEMQDRQVMVTITGPKKARQQLAGLCQVEMRDIHAAIPGLDPIEETQVQGTWIETATLELDEINSKETGIHTKENGTVMVDPTEQNNAYSEIRARSNDWKPTVFISYSKSDVSRRRGLETQLKILMNEGLLQRAWHDRMIDQGDKWDDAIQRELSEADIVIVLVSSAALATDYITKKEIPKALELHEKGITVVVPVILEACRWHNTLLSSLNALPEKGEPLNKWVPLSDGWHSISNGLATVFEKMIRVRVPRTEKWQDAFIVNN